MLSIYKQLSKIIIYLKLIKFVIFNELIIKELFDYKEFFIK